TTLFRSSAVVDVARDDRILQDRFRFRGEPQAAAVEPVVERLLAEAVAREQEAAPSSVPQREREHAAQHPNAVLAVVLVQMDDDLRVRVRGYAVSTLDERRLKLLVVVDLTVQNEDDAAILVEDRLVAGLEIDH